MKLKTLVLNVLLCLALASPALAESKSRTIQVSCSIPPMLNLSARALNQPMLSDAQFKMTEELRLQGGERVKLYSLTAL